MRPATLSIRLLASLCFAALLPSVQAKQVMSPAFREVSEVANSKELTPSEKVARLRELCRKEETRMTALYQLNVIDAAAAGDESLAIFRATDAARQTKLWIGHFILERIRPQQADLANEFVTEFASYLIEAILDGGEAEFCQKLEEHPTTAVGEYAYLASDFDGYKGIDLAPFKDSRLVPILIRCLDASDNVYAKNQGCRALGKPGEPTGRNTARQQIPVALAKLGDARAVQPLETALFNHKDTYLRMNASYALARLLDKQEDRAAIGCKLMDQADLLPCRFSFGRGLIEAGDDTGVEFLSMKHIGQPVDSANSLLYHLDERLNILQGFKSPKVENFVRETLDDGPWLDMILFKPGSVEIEPRHYLHPPKDEAEALEMSAPKIIKTYTATLECVKLNRLKSLSGKLEVIAKETRNATIRQMTEECLKAIQ